MNRIHSLHSVGPIRRVGAILAGLTASLLAFSAGAPAAFAYDLPPHGGSGGTVGPAPAHTIVTGGNGYEVGRFGPAPVTTSHAAGIAGWQIAVITIGAALAAAVVAILLAMAQARASRRTTPASAADQGARPVRPASHEPASEPASPAPARSARPQSS